MIIDDYFASIERGLHTYSRVCKIEEPFFCAASDDYNGVLRVRIIYWDQSFLDIHETVSTELGYPVRIHYAYTFIQNGIQTFRYDNAPHHREILTFPHHKHIGLGVRPIPSDQPSLNQVLIEISGLLGTKVS
jgi:hypothetical protein